MKQPSTIQKSYSILFLILTLFSLLGNSANVFLKKELSKKQERTFKTEKSADQSTPDETQLSETPFQAVVNAGLQWDIQKHFYILSPIVIDFFCPEKVKVQTPRFQEPLSYFVILFRTSICIHAP
jgi:hypothetical protein